MVLGEQVNSSSLNLNYCFHTQPFPAIYLNLNKWVTQSWLSIILPRKVPRPCTHFSILGELIALPDTLSDGWCFEWLMMLWLLHTHKPTIAHGKGGPDCWFHAACFQLSFLLSKCVWKHKPHFNNSVYMYHWGFHTWQISLSDWDQTEKASALKEDICQIYQCQERGKLFL